MANKKYILGLCIAVFVIGTLTGMAINISSIKSIIPITELTKKYETYDIDVASLIQIKTQADVQEKRNSLITYIWKDNGFPTNIPSLIETNITDNNFSDLPNLSQIDKFTIKMDNDVMSIAYFFYPKQPNNKLMIYHHGHDGGFIEGKKTIEFFLNNNYSVLAFSMPLTGMNNQPIVDVPNLGRIKLETHNHFSLLDSDKFSSLKYFVEPIAVSLNYIDAQFGFDSYYMVGISGGGWTTSVYTAIDPRISQSYSVAGSVPTYLRSSPNDFGDYEQILPDFYRIANYLDLYILDSYGQNREHTQIFNKYDPCCFAGEPAMSYENEIKGRLATLGNGSFYVYVDDTHKEHKISDYALKLIIENMNK